MNYSAIIKDSPKTEMFLGISESACVLSAFSIDPFERVFSYGLFMHDKNDEEKVEIANTYISVYNDIVSKYHSGVDFNMHNYKIPSHY